MEIIKAHSFISEIALPGDTFDINLNCDIMTHPTIGPLFGSFKVQLDVFLTPIRLYNAKLHMNAINVGRDMSKIKFPVIEINSKNIFGTGEDIDNVQINPSSLYAHLGYRGIGYNANPNELTAFRKFNAIPILNYYDIYKNYYANKQEEKGVIVHKQLFSTPVS